MTGTLFGVGVGPGDPELITLKAARVIREAAVVAYPANLEGHSQAREIARAHLRTGQVEIPIRLGFSRSGGDESRTYDAATALMAAHLEQGQDVVSLCEGDPLLFGTFVYLLDRLGTRYPFQIVPGISSPSAAAALLGRTLGRREQSFAIVPASDDLRRLSSALRDHDTVIILKPGRHRPRILALLQSCGRLRDGVYIENVSRGSENVVTDLERLPSTPGPYFALFLISRR